MKNRPTSALATSAGTWSELFAQGPAALRDILIETTHADLHEAFEALRTGNLARVEFVAHRMKGSARLMGDQATISACNALETQSRDPCIEQVNAALARVKQSFAEAYRTLPAANVADRD